MPPTLLLPLRYTAMVNTVSSLVLLSVSTARKERGWGYLVLGIITTGAAACLNSYVVMFGTRANGYGHGEAFGVPIVGYMTKRSSSASPETFRLWARIFRPMPPALLGVLDTVLFALYFAALVPYCVSLDGYSWNPPPVVLAAYCVMIMTIGLIIQAIFVLIFIVKVIKVVAKRDRARGPRLRVLCANCGDDIAGRGHPTAENPDSRGGMSFYAALAAEEGGAGASSLAGPPVVDVERVSRAIEEYKDDVPEEADGATSSAAERGAGFSEGGLYNNGS